MEVEGLGSEVGEDEGGSVELLGVVAELGLEFRGDLADGGLGEGRAVLSGEEEAEGTAGVGGGLGDGVGDGGEDLADELLHRRDEVQVQPDALRLGTEDTVLSQRLLHVGEVRLVEKLRGRTSGIRRVRDDHVEFVLVLLNELKTIANVNLHALILETNRGVGQELLRRIDHHLINLADVQLLN